MNDLTCPACEGAGGEKWRGLDWANCTRCGGGGEIKADDPYWAAREYFTRKAAA